MRNIAHRRCQASGARESPVPVRYAEERKNQSCTGGEHEPPMTARPSGAFGPGSIAMGNMPMIIASAVISTGRKRLNWQKEKTTLKESMLAINENQSSNKLICGNSSPISKLNQT
jgi:hypothetical protein